MKPHDKMPEDMQHFQADPVWCACVYSNRNKNTCGALEEGRTCRQRRIRSSRSDEKTALLISHAECFPVWNADKQTLHTANHILAKAASIKKRHRTQNEEYARLKQPTAGHYSKVACCNSTATALSATWPGLLPFVQNSEWKDIGYVYICSAGTCARSRDWTRENKNSRRNMQHLPGCKTLPRWSQHSECSAHCADRQTEHQHSPHESQGHEALNKRRARFPTWKRRIR